MTLPIEAYQAIFNATREAIFLHDAVSGAIIEVNQAMLDMFRVSRDQALRATADQFSLGEPPFSAAEAAEWIRRAREYGPQRFEWLARRGDGSLFWVEVSLTHTEKDGQEWVLAVVRDLSERKQMELEVSEARDMLQKVLDTIPVRVFWKNRQSVYLGCNQQFANDAGLRRPEELIGKTDLDLLWQDEAELYRRDDRQVMESGQPKLHYLEQQTMVSGEKRWLRTSKIPLVTEQGEVFGVLGTYEDITEQQQALEALSRKTAEFTAIFNSISDAVVFTDCQRRIRMINPAFSALFGYHYDELVGETTRLLYARAEDYHEQGRNRYHADARQQQDIYEMRYRKKDGSRFIGETMGVAVRDEEGKLFGFIGVIRDISDRKQAEAARRRDQETLQGIMRAAPSGICLVQERTFRWVSPRLCDITGYPQQELTGASVRILYFDEAEYQRVGQEYHQLDQGIEAEIETCWRRKDGTAVQVLLRGSPLDPDDPDQGIIVSVLDITARKEADQERQRLEKQMQHVQKLESLGILAGGIAHDFNNLLMAILGNADLALLETPPTSTARQHLLAIEKASRRAADLCRQMLAYSGKGKFVVERLDLSHLVRDITKMLEVSISKKAVLKFHYADTLPAIEADATQIRQIIMNLVINASEAIGNRSGIISITTGAMECDRKYLRETFLDEQLPEGIYAYIEVADTGCGMDMQTRARIFDPFFTTKFTGRGLGMAAVLGIVRGHRGCIKVYSEPGRGTTIKALFPAATGAMDAAGQLSSKEAGPWKGSGTILLVDDEETVRAVGRQMLERLGFSVITAADGREALKIFAEQGEDLACVLMDLTMPHMDGEEAFRELRRLRPEVTVVISSGYNEQEVTQRFMGKGVAGFIQKPYRLAELQEVLAKALQKR